MRDNDNRNFKKNDNRRGGAGKNFGRGNERKSYQKREYDRKDRMSKEEMSVEGEDNREGFESRYVEGRNAVTEAMKAGKPMDKLFVQEGLHDGPVAALVQKAKKQGTIITYVAKERLDEMSETGSHQGIIAVCAAYEYSEMEDIFNLAEKRGEDLFVFVLDEIEDPHNLGAIIRTANICGAHGVIIPKHRAVGLTATVGKASAGAINYTPVVKVTNIQKTIEELKEKGLWFACADMDGEVMYRANLTGPIGIVIGNEGKGVSRLVREKCDFVVSVPMKGEIESLNASVAAGVLAYEVVRQRTFQSK